MKYLQTFVLFLFACVLLNAQEESGNEATDPVEETLEMGSPEVPVTPETETTSEPEEKLEWIDTTVEEEKNGTPLSNWNKAKRENKREVETLAKGPFSLGFFVSQDTRVGDVNGEAALLMGGRASFVLNHKFNIGGAGYGLVSPVDPLGQTTGSEKYLVMGYGGMVFEPVFLSHKVIHFSVPILLGAGAYGTRNGNWNNFGPNSSEPFWVAEPGVNVNLNVFRVFQIGIGAEYRITSDVFVDDINTDKLNGFSGHLSLKFGWF